MKYIVEVREVRISAREVEADSAQEARESVENGEGDEIWVEYETTLDPDTWKVREAG